MTGGMKRATPRSIRVGDLCKPCQMFRAWHWEDQIGRGLRDRADGGV